MNLREQPRHRHTGFVIGKTLEAIEHLARHDLLRRPRNEPVIEENRRARIPHSPDVDLELPEAGFELRPVLAVRRFDICAELEQPLEYEILDEVRGRQLSAAGVERLEYLLCVLVGGKVDDHYLQ